MIYLLYISIGYLLFTTIIFLQNRKDLIPLRPVEDHVFTGPSPNVSICIPARNEEEVIERCVRSALKQTYPNTEVLVLDDESTDQTLSIIHKLKKNNPELRIFPGKPKPAEWLGKPWACYQLAQHARGDIIIFIDADTWLEPQTAGRVVRTMGHDVIDFLTVWPRQKLESFWEKMVIPLIYYALLTTLPVRYVSKAPRWLPSFLKKRLSPLFAAACGQFMAFKASAYEAIDGHSSVKSEIVDDVMLARNIKKAGFDMRMYHGNESVSCRMYTSSQKMYDGFRKNFLAGFNHNLLFFILVAMLHIIVFILPYSILLSGFFSGGSLLVWLSLLPVIFIIGQRLILDRWFGWNRMAGFLHPVGVLWFERLGVQVLRDYFTGASVQWKNRPL